MSDARATLTRLPALVDGTHISAFSDDETITVEAELVGPKEVADDDPKPSEFCPSHLPYGTTDSCGGCYRARLATEKWKKRNPIWLRAELYEKFGDPPTPSPPQQYKCGTCRDEGVALNIAGEPIRGRPVCHHDGTWGPATKERADR